jgi:hypothetical protein
MAEMVHTTSGGQVLVLERRMATEIRLEDAVAVGKSWNDIRGYLLSSEEVDWASTYPVLLLQRCTTRTGRARLLFHYLEGDVRSQSALPMGS